MLYSSEYNFVYSKSYKTASTSTEAALEYLIRGEIATRAPTASLLHENGSRIGYRGSNAQEDPNFNTGRFSINHASLEEIRNLIGSENFDSAIKISSIRNPYDRVISAFHYFGNQKLSAFIELKQNGNINAIKDAFAEYVHKDPTAKYDGREHFFCGSEMVIDHFVRKESIGEDLSFVMKRLDVPNEAFKNIMENIPTFKMSRRSESLLHATDYYTQEVLEIVNNRYSEWFAYGGYNRMNSTQELDESFS